MLGKDQRDLVMSSGSSIPAQAGPLPQAVTSIASSTTAAASTKDWQGALARGATAVADTPSAGTNPRGSHIVHQMTTNSGLQNLGLDLAQLNARLGTNPALTASARSGLAAMNHDFQKVVQDQARGDTKSGLQDFVAYQKDFVDLISSIGGQKSGNMSALAQTYLDGQQVTKGLVQQEGDAGHISANQVDSFTRLLSAGQSSVASRMSQFQAKDMAAQAAQVSPNITPEITLQNVAAVSKTMTPQELYQKVFTQEYNKNLLSPGGQPIPQSATPAALYATVFQNEMARLKSTSGNAQPSGLEAAKATYYTAFQAQYERLVSLAKERNSAASANVPHVR